jgi:nucleotidyltransferase substrate binding protein (TIGR01987 family)
MALDLTALRSALDALNKSFAYLKSDLAKDPDLREQFRAASIQAFEFTYELGFKMLRRRSEEISATPAALKGESYMSVIRAGAEAGLAPDIERFRRYREIRDITSHTYAPKVAPLREVWHQLSAISRELLAPPLGLTSLTASESLRFPRVCHAPAGSSRSGFAG